MQRKRSQSKGKKRRNTGPRKGNPTRNTVRVASKEQYTRTEGSKLSSPGLLRSPKTLKIFNHDIGEKDVEHILGSTLYINVDTETDGLLYRRDRLRLVQVCTPDGEVYFIRNPTWASKNLRALLEDSGVKIVFHHAYFDLGFLKYWMGVEINPENVYCTKVMSKILEPTLSSSLGPVRERHLGIRLESKDKSVTKSDWNAPELSKQQVEYAYGDVLNLDTLSHVLWGKLKPHQKLKFSRAMYVVTYKAYNEAEGYTDLDRYEHDENSVIYRDQWDNHL
jgi:ribonuclease D